MSININQFEAVPIKELCQKLRMSEDALKPKIPTKFRLQIGKSVRYDLYGIVEYFRTGEDGHEDLLSNLLK